MMVFDLAKSQFIMVEVLTKLTIDKLGRIVLPKPVREKLQLSAGDELELESLDDRITLRPLRGTAQLRKKSGVWVFHSGEPLSAATVQETIEQGRRERDDTRAVPSRL
jgi:AbrB family looped-hinge helix DNA binding protein